MKKRILSNEEGARWNSDQCAVLANGLDLVRRWSEGACQIKQMEPLLQDLSVYESKGRLLLAACRDPSNWLIKALVKAELKDEILEIFQGFLDSMNGFMAITEAIHIPVETTETNKQIPAEAAASAGSFSGQLSVDIRMQKVLPAGDSSQAKKFASLKLAGFPRWAYSDLLDVAREVSSIIHVKLPEAAAEDRLRQVERLNLYMSLSSTGHLLVDENSQELLGISQYLLKRLRNAGTENVLHLDPPHLTYEGEALGHGAFGVVHKARWRGFDIAVKEYSFAEDLHTEVRNMLSLSHINVIRVIGYYMSRSGKKMCPHLLMECMSCDLDNFIEEMDGQGGVPLVTCIEILLQIAKGMEYLHKNKVIHRDLKPGNILLNCSKGEGHFTVKIADFGTSRIQFDTAHLTHVTGKRGTINYMAPEVWDANEDGDKEVCYSKKVDVYSFAMVCYEILTGNAPDVHPKLAKEGKRPDLSLLSEYPALVHLMQQCWDSDAKKRPSFRGIHKFLHVLKSIILFRPEEMGQYHALSTKILGKNMGLDTDENVMGNLVEESEPIEEDNLVTHTHIVAEFSLFPDENGTDNLVQESEPGKNPKFLDTVDTDENEENRFLDTYENEENKLVEESKHVVVDKQPYYNFLPRSCQKGNLLLPVYFD